ncbi:MAG: membrane dipeptidase [Bacteroidales bacterium]|nr:membrane dipeptidase [Bacteroidales bacterium]
MSLYALERPMIYGNIKKVNNINIDLLTISNYINKLDYELLGSIAFHQKGYNNFLKELKQHLLNSKDLEQGFKVLNNINELEENKLNIIFSIEGGHALFSEVEHYTVQEVSENLNLLKNDEYPYLYLTLTHLTQSPLCNHAYGMKIIKHEQFKPKGDGISYLGFDVIRNALSNTNGRRILIDIKHMSLKARLQYYELLKNEFNDVPIVASHVGVTGISYKNMPIKQINDRGEYVEVSYKKPKGLMKTTFNPFSINLYDEDILAIIESDGIIGINLDERILGNKQNKEKDKIEYFSKEEFGYYRVTADRDSYGETILGNSMKFIKWRFSFRKDIKHLANNILYIIKIGGENAWEHVCIGSDFDGMINPIESCRNARKFEKLEKKLLKILPKMIKEDLDTNYYCNDVEKRIYQLMYGNVKRFLDIYFV